MKKIIAITGLKGSGKDTTADFIIKHNKGWEKDSFAASLKDAVSAIFGWDRKMLAGETPEDRTIRESKDDFWSDRLGFDVTPRNILQKLGTDCIRNHFNNDIWVYSLEHKIHNASNNVIITDCRFQNEITQLKKLGATFIRVMRDPIPEWFSDAIELNHYKQGGLNLPNEHIFSTIEKLKNVHISEYDWIGVDYPDYIISNNGSLEDLEQEVCKIMEKINGVV